jgi:hypothetical protein
MGTDPSEASPAVAYPTSGAGSNQTFSSHCAVTPSIPTWSYPAWTGVRD